VFETPLCEFYTAKQGVKTWRQSVWLIMDDEHTEHNRKKSEDSKKDRNDYAGSQQIRNLHEIPTTQC
jgi:hypothetical protein